MVKEISQLAEKESGHQNTLLMTVKWSMYDITPYLSPPCCVHCVSMLCTLCTYVVCMTCTLIMDCRVFCVHHDPVKPWFFYFKFEAFAMLEKSPRTEL